MTEQLEFPAAEADDAEDVAWQLQTAGTMWARGDHHEAIRWLRRAAEAASDAGADLRSVKLARAAADLTTALEIPPSMPPPAAVPTATAPSAPAHSETPRLPTPPPPPVRSAPASAVPPARASTRPPPAMAVRQRQALRVAVHPSDSATGELMVRPLAEDEAPGDGEHEALLVALEAGAHLLSKKR